jgi:hypothetical protein
MREDHRGAKAMTIPKLRPLQPENDELRDSPSVLFAMEAKDIQDLYKCVSPFFEKQGDNSSSQLKMISMIECSPI